MSSSNEQLYTIPNRYRRMENLHIFLWLFKDIGWCLELRLLGVIMIVPTLTIAILIGWRTRKIVSELYHNIAVALWIAANSYWMISEFFGFDEVPVWNGYHAKYLTLIPFFAGVLILGYYYIVLRPKEMRDKEDVVL